jgi:3-oxoacyl-[acyl-carrier protein] reductase
VNCVLPGRIATDRIVSLDQATAEASGRSPEEVRAERDRAVPVGRSGDPAEFGATVAFLCSEAAAYITGASVPVDGGVLAGHW